MPKLVENGNYKKPASLRHTESTKRFLESVSGKDSAQKGFDYIIAFSIKYEPMLKKFIEEKEGRK